MDTSLFIGLVLLCFGLMIFSLKLMAYNRKKYGMEVPKESTDADFGKILSRNTFRMLVLIILQMTLIILIYQPQTGLK